MTITTTTMKTTAVGTGVLAAIPIPFPFFSASELEVLELTTASGAVTAKTLSSDYSVSGGDGGTGSVTPTTAIPLGKTWYIRRNTARTQLTDYRANDPFQAEMAERTYDRLQAQIQELAEVAGRAVQLSKTSARPTPPMEDPVTGQVPLWDGSKFVFQSVADLGDLSFVQAYDIDVSLQHTPITGEAVLTRPIVRAISLPANLSGSVAYVRETAQSLAQTFTIYAGATAISTVSFAVGSTAGIFTGPEAAVVLAEGDVLRIVLTSSPDAYFREAGIVLKGLIQADTV